jgi:hypothetical protein
VVTRVRRVQSRAVKLRLRYPATAENAHEHAELAVEVAREQFDDRLDYTEDSVDRVDAHIDTLREDGLSAEDAAEALFVMGCYLGEVMRRELSGRWLPTLRSELRQLSPWPMVVRLPSGSTWDPIGKVFKRFELGDSEYLPAYFHAAAHGAGPQH